MIAKHFVLFPSVYLFRNTSHNKIMYYYRKKKLPFISPSSSSFNVVVLYKNIAVNLVH